MTVPILVLGDAPNQPTGLGRIARDIMRRLWGDSIRVPDEREFGEQSPVLDINVAQLGFGYDGSPWPWRVWPVLDTTNWGEGDIGQVWKWHCGDEPGVLFTVWDPARVVGTRDQFDPDNDWRLDGQRWGYFAVDGTNPNGVLGGPAKAALDDYHRVLAYGEWGGKVLKKTLDKIYPVQWLPHGIDLEVFKPITKSVLPAGAEEWAMAALQKLNVPILGMVAANQPRKDFATFFASANETAFDEKPFLWIHTDKLTTRAWSITELASIYGYNDPDDPRLLVTLELADEQLAAMYNLCDVTVLPTRGEGFGYPIVESLACGTPIVTTDHAGGTELVPRDDWRVWSPFTNYVEGSYALERPVLDARDFATAIEKAYDFAQEPFAAEYCRGSVAHLDWAMLWPRWRDWFRRGLEEFGS